MSIISITEKELYKSNIDYIKECLHEVFARTNCSICDEVIGDRIKLLISCQEDYISLIRAEIIDKVAEIIAIKYKYEFFNREIKIAGLEGEEREIFLASVIAADLDGDKKFCYDKMAELDDIAIDGVFNFRLPLLKRKWREILTYMPSAFLGSELKDFITYLYENKKERVYIDSGRVYDCHYKRLNRCDLLGGKNIKIIREILLSNCGEIKLYGKLPLDDEKYLKEFYGGKIIFSNELF